jgi:hypothetical protein
MLSQVINGSVNDILYRIMNPDPQPPGTAAKIPASEPRSLGASEPRSLGASEPRSLGASEPRSL